MQSESAIDKDNRSLVDNTLSRVGRQSMLAPGDGSCLFHALALFTQMTSKHLRELAIQCLEEGEETFGEGDNQARKDALRELKTPDGWGNAFAIAALCQELQVAIAVIEKEGRVIWFREDLPNKGVWLIFDGNHYDAAVDPQQQVEFQRACNRHKADQERGKGGKPNSAKDLGKNEKEESRGSGSYNSQQHERKRVKKGEAKSKEDEVEGLTCESESKDGEGCRGDDWMTEARWQRVEGGVRVAAVNCTSFHAHEDEILACEADAIVLSEARMGAQAQRSATARCHKRGWKVIWGAPQALRGGEKAAGDQRSTPRPGGLPSWFEVGCTRDGWSLRGRMNKSCLRLGDG
jgi:hypothetical protein